LFTSGFVPIHLIVLSFGYAEYFKRITMGLLVGLFGYNYLWPQLFILTFVVHVVHGTILGSLTHLWLKPTDNKWLWPFLKN